MTPLYLGVAPRHRPQVMHWTSALPLKARGLVNVYTIHDLVPLRLPFTTLDFEAQFFDLYKHICSRRPIISSPFRSRPNAISSISLASAEPAARIANTCRSVSLPPALLAQSGKVVAAEVEGVFGLGWKRYFLFFGSH